VLHPIAMLVSNEGLLIRIPVGTSFEGSSCTKIAELLYELLLEVQLLTL